MSSGFRRWKPAHAFWATSATPGTRSFPHQPLADQDIVITLPASFDEVARELTVEAAAMAELPRVVLIEEPQAAFYAWVYKHQDDWQQQVDAGHTILVCDIGGGTSDFTLIKVRRTRIGRWKRRSESERQHSVSPHRGGRPSGAWAAIIWTLALRTRYRTEARRRRPS